MQAMILAAGLGTRLRPLTLTTPKPLVKVGGQSLIVWHLARLKAAGFLDVVINVAHLGEQIIAHLGNDWHGVAIRYSIEDTPQETAGGIRLARQRGLLDDAPFLLVNGDVYSDFDFARARADLGNDLAHLWLVDSPWHAGDFALNDDRVQPDGTPKYTFSGISVLSPALICDDSSPKLAPHLVRAMTQTRVRGAMLGADWVDVGTMARLDALNARLDPKIFTKI